MLVQRRQAFGDARVPSGRVADYRGTADARRRVTKMALGVEDLRPCQWRMRLLLLGFGRCLLGGLELRGAHHHHLPDRCDSLVDQHLRAGIGYRVPVFGVVADLPDEDEQHYANGHQSADNEDERVEKLLVVVPQGRLLRKAVAIIA